MSSATKHVPFEHLSIDWQTRDNVQHAHTGRKQLTDPRTRRRYPASFPPREPCVTCNRGNYEILYSPFRSSQFSRSLQRQSSGRSSLDERREQVDAKLCNTHRSLRSFSFPFSFRRIGLPSILSSDLCTQADLETNAESRRAYTQAVTSTSTDGR